MQESQFTIVYDKKMSEFATMLHTLASEIESVKNVKIELKKFESGMLVTDKDYVFFIGNDSTKEYRNNFKDKYSKYGIHIGYRGCKAWIYCENNKWAPSVYEKFYEDLLKLYMELDMNMTNIKEAVDVGMKDFVAMGSTKAPIGSTIAQQFIWNDVVSLGLLIAPNPIILIWNLIKSLLTQSKQVKQRYRFATVLFYKDYLTEFLKINRDEDNPAN